MDNLNYLFQLLHTPSPCLLLSLVQTMNTGKWFPTSFKLTALTCYGLLLLWGTYAMPSCLSGFPSLSGTPPSQGAKPINVQLDNSPRNQQEWTLFLRASGKAPTSTPGLKFCFYHKNVFCGILNSSKLPSRQATTHCDRTQFSLGQLVPSGVLLPAHHEKHERETLCSCPTSSFGWWAGGTNGATCLFLLQRHKTGTKGFAKSTQTVNAVSSSWPHLLAN